MFIPSTAKELAELLKQEGIQNPRVLDAIAATPRHLFIDPSLQDKAYWDRPLALSHGQTISQPFVVARMTEVLLAAGALNKVLEVGTGSGYQAAILSCLVKHVYTVERIAPLYTNAKKLFQQLNFTNIVTQLSDGNEGWPEHAPFDGIIVTAAAQTVPVKLLEQLTEGGRMIVPVGDQSCQQLQLIVRQGNNYHIETLDPVIFVPLLAGIQH